MFLSQRYYVYEVSKYIVDQSWIRFDAGDIGGFLVTHWASGVNKLIFFVEKKKI